MKSSTDVIAAALDAALSPRPLNYTTADLAKTVEIALGFCGFAIVPVEPDVDTLLKMAEQHDFAGWPSAYRAMVEMGRAKP